MGIRFSTNTWRAPLVLIDCWLPPAAERAASPNGWTRSVQRFVRAGWLGRHKAVALAPAGMCPAAPNPAFLQTRRSYDRSTGGARVFGAPGKRMAISGRMGDVCAELDRLAELEIKGFAAHR